MNEAGERKSIARHAAAGAILGILSAVGADVLGVQPLLRIPNLTLYLPAALVGAILGVTRLRPLLWITAGIIALVCVVVAYTELAPSLGRPLIRLNFIAIVSALDALATGNVDRANPKRYEELPMNASGLLYIAIRNGTVINGSGIAPYVADIGITGNRRVRTVEGKREVHVSTNISDLGDLRTSGALREIDATGMTVVPDTGYTMGALVDLPDWRTKTEVTIGTGQSPRLALLRPGADGKYQVELVLRDR